MPDKNIDTIFVFDSCFVLKKVFLVLFLVIFGVKKRVFFDFSRFFRFLAAVNYTISPFFDNFSQKSIVSYSFC